MRVGCAGHAQIPVTMSGSPEQSRSVTSCTCVFKVIQLGWHKGSNWPQISCSGLWCNFTLSIDWKLLVCYHQGISACSYNRPAFQLNPLLAFSHDVFIITNHISSDIPYSDFILQKHSSKIPSGLLTAFSLVFWLRTVSINLNSPMQEGADSVT